MNRCFVKFDRSVKCLLCALVVMFSVSNLCAETIDVVVITPDYDKEQGFTASSMQLMEEVSGSFDVSLEVLYSNTDPRMMIEHADEISLRENKPDYVIVTGVIGASLTMLRSLDKAGIKTVVYNGALSLSELEVLKQDPLDHWVGSILPNDIQSGYILAEVLVDSAREKELFNDENKIEIFGITGAERSMASEKRFSGLMKYIDENTDVVLLDSKSVNWNQDLANVETYWHLTKNENTAVVWAASDMMAVGAMEAAVELEMVPGEQIVSAGVDWFEGAHPYINDGTVLGSVGGHMFDAAWIVIALYDHYHGHHAEPFDYETDFTFVDGTHLHQVAKAVDPLTWKEIDFKQWSKEHGLKGGYNFGAGLILNSLFDAELDTLK